MSFLVDLIDTHFRPIRLAQPLDVITPPTYLVAM